MFPVRATGRLRCPSPEQVLDPKRELAFPESVVEFFEGKLGQPPGEGRAHTGRGAAAAGAGPRIDDDTETRPLARPRTAVVLIFVVSVPVVGSVTPMLCRRSSPLAMRGR